MVLGAAAAHAEQQASPVRQCVLAAPGEEALLACHKAEYARQDKRLNDAFRALVPLAGQNAGINANPDVAGTRKSLRAAQQAWVAFRDKECAWQGERHARGPDIEMAETLCLARVTARRADELESLVRLYRK
ncbi:MAG: lysozyme inhibitor LprI family protein [Alphaproteobacteria bacterium]